MKMKIDAKTSLLLRVLLYVSLLTAGVYGSRMIGDVWIQIARIDAWCAEGAAVLCLMCLLGKEVSGVLVDLQNRVPAWSVALRRARRSFACFGFMLLGTILAAVPPNSAAGTKFFVFLFGVLLLGTIDPQP